jgi:hypothetical protein
MRIFSIAAIAAVTLGFAFAGIPSATAQSDESTSHRKIYGYQDPETGDFHPLGKFRGPVPDAATTAPTTGTLEVVAKITLKTPLPKGGTIICGASFIASSFSTTAISATSYEESADVLAVVSGSTATCTLKLPYSWVLPPPSSTVQDSLSGSLSVQMFQPVSSTTTTAIEAALVRGNAQPIVSATKFPANGATTIYNLNVTL